jgi:hypothetical protein
LDFKDITDPTLAKDNFPTLLKNRHNFILDCIGGCVVVDCDNDLPLMVSCGLGFDFSIFKPFSNVRISRNQTLENISCYPIATILKIEDCPNLKEVSFLKFVRDLSLINCLGIEDISELKYNRKLTILECKNIKDTKGLFQGCHEYLSTDLVHTIRDEQPIFFKSLALEESKITSVALLSTLYKVLLNSCSELKTLKGLENVPIVNLERCDQVTSLLELESNRFVRLHEMHSITDFSPLKNHSRVEISVCWQSINASNLENVHHLIIRQCNKLENVSSLGRVYRLELHSCAGILSLQGLENVSEIILDSVDPLSDIRGLGNNRFISCKTIPSQFLDQLSIHLLEDQRYSKCKNIEKSSYPFDSEWSVITQFFRNECQKR